MRLPVTSAEKALDYIHTWWNYIGDIMTAKILSLIRSLAKLMNSTMNLIPP